MARVPCADQLNGAGQRGPSQGLSGTTAPFVAANLQGSNCRNEYQRWEVFVLGDFDQIEPDRMSVSKRTCA